MFRGKLYWDRFKNNLSEYILSPSFVFKLPSAPLCLVFSHGGGGKKFLPWFWGCPTLWSPPSVLCLNLASGCAESRAEGLKERSLAETCCHSPRGKQRAGLLARTVVRRSGLGRLASPGCALTLPGGFWLLTRRLPSSSWAASRSSL